MALELVAPANVRKQVKDVMVSLANASSGTGDAARKLLEAVRTLIDQLREDLVPEHMR